VNIYSRIVSTFPTGVLYVRNCGTAVSVESNGIIPLNIFRCQNSVLTVGGGTGVAMVILVRYGKVAIPNNRKDFNNRPMCYVVGIPLSGKVQSFLLIYFSGGMSGSTFAMFPPPFPE